MWIRFSLRSAAGRLLVAGLVLLGSGAASAAPPKTGSRLFVETPRADPAVQPLAAGIAEWLRVEFAASGVRVTARGGGDAADLRLATDLRGDGRRCDVRLRVYGGHPEKLIAGVHREGAFPEIAALVQTAAADVLERIGLPGESLREAMTPSLAELARTARALQRLERGEFAGAWREIGNRASATAAALREEIGDSASAPSVSEARRARLLTAQGDPDRAWQLVEGSLESTRDPEVVLAAAEAARERRNPRQALVLFSRAVEMEPDSSDAQLGLGRTLADARRLGDSRRALIRAASLNPDDPTPVEALAALEEGDPRHRAERLLEAASRARARYEPRRARRFIEAAREAGPERDARIERESGLLYEGVGEPAKARVAYEQAVALDPTDLDSLRDLGRTRRSAGDPGGAESAYRAVLARRPDDRDALRQLGELYVAEGRDEEAAPLFERALALDPSDTEARRRLAEWHHEQGDSERALEILSEGEEPTAEALGVAARIHRERGDSQGESTLLLRAIELDPVDESLHTELAASLDAQGETQRAREARAIAERLGGSGVVEDQRNLAAFEPDSPTRPANPFNEIASSYPAQNPTSGAPLRRIAVLGIEPGTSWRTRVHHWLAPHAVDTGRLLADLTRALSLHYEVLAPDAPGADLEAAALRDFRANRAAIARVNDANGSDAVFVGRLAIEPTSANTAASWLGLISVEIQLLAGSLPTDVAALSNVIVLDPVVGFYETWNPRALALYGALTLIVLLRLIRGWGSALIRIDYQVLGQGFFTIRFSRKPGRASSGRRSATKSARFRQRVRALSRFERTIVGREARFRWLPAREYFVSVHGLFEDPHTHEVIGNYLEEQKVRIRRRKTTETEFNFRPVECAVEIVVNQGDQPVNQAMVAVEGKAGSLRFTRNGSTHLYLGTGSHRILIGLADRVTAHPLRIDALEPRSLVVNLSDPRHVVFENCPSAVEPYLQGALEPAAFQLDAAGETQAALEIRARLDRSRGDEGAAAERLEQAEQWLEAAELRLALGQPGRAAALYVRGGDYPAAAESYRAAGNPGLAGQAYERVYDHDAAIECYREAGDLERLAAVLEKTDAYLEAGEVAIEAEDWDRAIAILQRVEPREGDYPAACRLLADVLVRQGEAELAIAKYQECVAAASDERVDLEILARLARLLEQVDRGEEALEAYRAIRRRDLQREGIAERIDALQQRIARQASERKAFESLREDSQAENRYEVLAELGRGGMGIVHQARDKRLGRIVALKRLPENLRDHPKAVQLFLREARAAAALNHPNVVTLHDVGNDEGSYFITMECLSGYALNEVLAKKGRLSVRDCARIGIQVAAGLQYAHSENIVHRDIKTANLFVTRDRVVKIMDFGLAKTLEKVRAAATTVGGTPYYMAPEQAAGQEVDHRADLYALGVTLFELVTGEVPFPEGDALYHHRHTPAPDPREKVEGVTDGFAELVLELMAKDPADRPPNAEAVRRRLLAEARPSEPG